MPAAGIHAHPDFKTGLKKSDPTKRILAIDEVLTPTATAELPKAEDRYAGVTFTMGANDRFGTCGPTSLANNRRSTSKVALGTQRTDTDNDVFALYKLSGNPNFNPNNPNTEDNGVEMGSMLDAALAHGFAGEKLVAFGRSTKIDDATIERLVATFGGVLFAVDLEVAQQAQTEGHPPVWDYKASGEWGGHAIYDGKYRIETTASGLVVLEAPVITWDEEVGTTDAFRKHQLEEVWVPIWEWHLEHPAFLAGVDVAAFAEAFHELTGKTLPIPAPSPTPTPPPTPTPTPTPTPAPSPDAADAALWAALEHWSVDEKHVGDNRKAATAARTWATEKGLL